MLVCSAIKNSANGLAAYLTLKPEMNSDSTSVRSNGAWLVTARFEINRIIVNGQAGMISQVCS